MTSETWLDGNTVAQLADIAPRRVRKAIASGTWRGSQLTVRQVADRAGGANGNTRYQLLLSSLPEDLQRRYRAQRLPAFPALPAPEGLPPQATEGHPILAPQLDGLKTWQQDILTARAKVLDTLDHWVAGGMTLAAAIDTLIYRCPPELQPYLAQANARKGQQRHVSASTIYRWLDKRARQGATALAPRAGQPPLTIPDWLPPFLQLYQRPQKPTIEHCVQQLVTQHPDLALPAASTIRRFLHDHYSRYDLQRGRHTGAALRRFGFHHRRSSDGMLPMQEVHADGWSTHFLAPHPKSGKFVVWEVWHFHDVATRRVFPFAIGPSESFLVIAEGLRRCIEVGGIPLVLQTDCTGSVKNDRFELDPVTSIAARAGITLVHTLPGNLPANGICENFNKTWLDKHARDLATYNGKGMDRHTHSKILRLGQKMLKAHNHADNVAWQTGRDAIAATGLGLCFDTHTQALDWLQAQVDAWNHHQHRSLPKIIDPQTGRRRHQTPLEARNQALENGWEPVRLDAPDLLDLFRPHERVTVPTATFGSTTSTTTTPNSITGTKKKYKSPTTCTTATRSG